MLFFNEPRSPNNPMNQLKKPGSELNSDFLFFCSVFCFVFLGSGGPGGGFGAPGGGFFSLSSSSGLPLLLLSLKPPPGASKPPPGPPEPKKTKQKTNDTRAETPNRFFVMALCVIVIVIDIVTLFSNRS